MLQTEGGIAIYYLLGTVILLLFILGVISFALLHQKKLFRLRVLIHEKEFRTRQAVFNALQEGQEQERTRLAEELHDGVGARLSGLKMSLEYLKSNTTENKALLEKVFSGVAETLEEIRTISHNLQPYFFDNKDLKQLLLDFMEQLSMMNGCRYNLHTNQQISKISSTVKLYCYRIIAELLNNIRKHAKATVAFVQVNVVDDTIEIVVEDDGVGMPTNTSTDGIGLINIKNRIRACNGTLSIDASAKGTTVIATLPLHLPYE